jgi:pimeloyl-ACP methyl ester carboxylesterase
MLRETEFNTDGICLNVMTGPVAGPPLLLLHGVTRRWQTFTTILPALCLRWHVHALDFPGHGRSQRTPDRYRVVDYVRIAAALLRERFSEPVVVYGHSLGAMVAAGVAAEVPASVRAIVMEDPPFHTMGCRICETALRGYFEQLRAFAGSSRPLAEVVRELAEVRLTDPSSGASQRLGDIRDEAALRFTAASLAKLDPDTLKPVVEGMVDQDAELAAEKLSQGCRVKFNGIGHLIHGTKPVDLMTVVTPFLDSLWKATSMQDAKTTENQTAPSIEVNSRRAWQPPGETAR